MAKISIKIDQKTGVCYVPKSIRSEGFTGVIELLHNALTVTLVKPGTDLADVGRSLELVRKDLVLRRQQEDVMHPETKKVGKSSETAHGRLASTPHHPIFKKYTREHLHEVTGFSKGYLSRIATGKITMSSSFIERMC